jgi:hypothetical protein
MDVEKQIRIVQIRAIANAALAYKQETENG